MSEQPLTTPSEGSSTSTALGEAVQGKRPRGGDAWKRKVSGTRVISAITGGFRDTIRMLDNLT